MSGRHGRKFPGGRQGLDAIAPSSAGARAVLPLFIVWVVFLVWVTPATARAFDKAFCVDSHTSAQKSMKAGRLQESKEQLLVCANSTCPQLVREDCEKWLSNIDRKLQPVTIEARDAAGKLLMAVRVPVEVQPEAGTRAATETGSGPRSGPSNATVPSDRTTCDRAQPDCSNAADAVERPPEAPQSNASVAAEEAPLPPTPPAALVGPQGAGDQPLPGDDLVRVPAAQPRHSLPTAAWVTGALALASFGTAAILGLTGLSQARSLRETCAPNCPSSRVSAVRQDLLIADLSALSGVAFSAATAWMFWSHREAGANEGGKPDATKLSAWITGRSFRLDYAASF